MQWQIHYEDKYLHQSFLISNNPSVRLNSGEDPGGDRVGRDVTAPLLATGGAQVDVNVVAKGVLDDDRAGTIGVERSNRLNTTAARVSVAAGAAQDGGSNGHELGELGHHVVSGLEGVAAVVDGDETGASATATAGQVRAVLGSGAKGPGSNTGGPVLERAHGEVGGLVPGTSGWGPALSHVLVSVGV